MKTVRQYCSSLKTWLSTPRGASPGAGSALPRVDIDLDSIANPPRDAPPDGALGDPWRTQPAVRRKPNSG